mmetsp:Transcript_17642/g.38233  ORF Transcript_17642/g.38233 Transcript_17642/m.38233 type:complete len:484 (-) Transcript_17642:74-1525(-)|eukprot:CAMPEP_0172539712 /NCGR_PEP_ID=MMETSP1067-20121228/10860_1 /TAXON_ID=265564 ORGANISM="Thalassiosira punctigera, Strain Tpunct2005C2" /NCGR_SAMPLE_ID=MMETSP1067 /ASSEMBLY_ACC=CAM_ASM_000444 /LENGTH=483 /DNA_ID=CAMNT_0013325439 /DNA_START=54 /DNA_END=1505 /DNA_ORIENTATION=+
MAWGKGGSLRSCDALLKRVEDNDPLLSELVILPMKTFGPSDVERLSRAIASGSNTHLHSVSASGHDLPPKSLKRFALALSAQAIKMLRISDEEKTSGITSVAIGSKDTGDEGVVAFCEGLQATKGGLLQSLDFGWKNLGKDGMQAIGKTFGASRCVTYIDLSRNAIGSEGITCMANAIKEKSKGCSLGFPSLEKIILSECNISSSGVHSLSEIIFGEGSNRCESIHLAIGSNPIEAEGCGALSKLCSIPGRGSMISHLQLSQCSIGDEGVKLLSSAAMSNSCTWLTFLDLSDNSITKDGAETFAKSLTKSWPDLVELKLAQNELGAEGVTSVMEALVTSGDAIIDGPAEKKNSTLQNLDLSCTNCGINGAKSTLLSGALTTLRLFDNRLGSVGFNALSPLLEGGHPTIENLDLGGNSAGEEAVVSLLNSIADRREEGPESKLSVLEIGGNKFGDNALEALNELKRVKPLLDVAHDKPVREAEE